MDPKGQTTKPYWTERRIITSWATRETAERLCAKNLKDYGIICSAIENPFVSDFSRTATLTGGPTT
jgi:hypothetical protein